MWHCGSCWNCVPSTYLATGAFRQGLLPEFGLGIGVPLLTVVVWAMFIAPNAVVHLPEPVSFVLGLAILLQAAVALAAGQPTLAAAIRTLFDLNNEGDTYKLLALGVFPGAAALLIFRTHVLPRWLGLFAIVLAPLLVVAAWNFVLSSSVQFAAYAVLLLLLLLWVAAVSVVCLRRAK